MKTRFLTYILLLCGVLVSCDRTDRRLRDIDSIMESDPETALEQLRQINPKELSESDYAFYALLFTQAQYKNNYIVDSDSLIKFAYAKYAIDGSDNLRMRTRFYNAKVSLDKKDYRSSMKDAVVAYDIAKENNISYWIAKSAELMADIFWYIYNYTQAELYTKEAVMNYLLAGRIDNHRYALCDLASTYLNENRINDAVFIVDSLYDIVIHETPLDSALLDYMSMSRSSVLLRTNRLDELQNIIKKTPEITDEYESDWEIDELVNESILLNIKGEHERAIPLLNDLYRSTKDEKQRIRVLYGLYWLAFSNNRYKDAAEMADSIIMMQGRIAEELLNQSITEEQNNYYLQKAKDQQKQARIRTYALLTVIVVAILILGLLSIIFRLKIRANKAKLEAGIASLLNYKGQIEQIGIENKRLSSELLEQSQTIENLKKNVEYNSQFEEETAVILENMFREKWKTFNMLCSEYFKLDDTEQSKSVVLNNIAAELKKLKEKKSLKEIEHAVDKYMGGIMSMLREECAFLTEKDFQFLSLVYAGLSAKSTCLLTDSNPSSFYVKKNRISKRIATSNAPHLELFIRKLR